MELANVHCTVYSQRADETIFPGGQTLFQAPPLKRSKGAGENISFHIFNIYNMHTHTCPPIHKHTCTRNITFFQ